jgi:hypothetical protein
MAKKMSPDVAEAVAGAGMLGCGCFSLLMPIAGFTLTILGIVYIIRHW